MKYSFRNDYSEGAHPKILDALLRTNLEQFTGYGTDPVCRQAARLICEKIMQPDAAVHFLTGGTQTNLIALSAFLKPHEAVIAACSSHVWTHETGAVEATGHKIIPVETADGKLKPADIAGVLQEHQSEHMVKPRLVYLSDSTEIGTIYLKDELSALSRYCREQDLLLYLDGARLGSALTARENDLTLPLIAGMTDAFYIGGTKNGAWLGEALVIRNPVLQPDFRYHLKQNGALLAKGKLLGVQFLELFKDDLYFDLAHHANHMADKLKTGLDRLGVEKFVQSPTNQVFPVLSNHLLEKLEADYEFEYQRRGPDGHSVIRLVTSWATPEMAVIAFLNDLQVLLTIPV